MREHDQPRLRTRHGVWIGLIIAVAIAPALPAQVGVSAGPGIESPADPIDLSAQRSSTGTGRASAGPCSRARPPCSRGPRACAPAAAVVRIVEISQAGTRAYQVRCLRRGGRPDHGASTAARELASRRCSRPGRASSSSAYRKNGSERLPVAARRAEDPRAVRPQAGRAGGRAAVGRSSPAPAIAAGAASPPLPELEPVPERQPARRDPELKPARIRTPGPAAGPRAGAGGRPARGSPGAWSGRRAAQVDLPPIEGEQDVVVPNLINPDDVPRSQPLPGATRGPARAAAAPRRAGDGEPRAGRGAAVGPDPAGIAAGHQHLSRGAAGRSTSSSTRHPTARSP